MATIQKPAPTPVVQQQGDGKPAGQMSGTAEPKPQQGQPIYRDWASI